MDAPSIAPMPVREPVPVKPSIFRERLVLHFFLFALTYLSVSAAGVAETWRGALSFSTALLAILLSHELGHYVAGRRYGVDVSLPYFIPAPFLGIGTFGAVIRIRSPIPTRNALVDIGAAGPIAGMIVAVPLLLWGIAHSHYEPVLYEPGLHLPGRTSLAAFAALVARAARMGPWTPSELWARIGHLLQPALTSGHFVGWSGDSLLSLGATRLMLGPPPPGADVVLHPVAYAAWFGLLVTLLNLFPIGQLDGGHVGYAVLGRERARWLGHLFSLLLVAMAVLGSFTWLVWFALTRFLVGVGHPPVVRPEEPLARSRAWVAAISLALLVLTFLPVPFEVRPVP